MDDAIRKLKEASSLMPTDDESLDHVVSVMLNANKAAEALQYLQSVEEQRTTGYPRSLHLRMAEVLLNLVRSREGANAADAGEPTPPVTQRQIDDVLRHLRAALALDPYSDAAEHAIKRLERLGRQSAGGGDDDFDEDEDDDEGGGGGELDDDIEGDLDQLFVVPR